MLIPSWIKFSLFNGIIGIIAFSYFSKSNKRKIGTFILGYMIALTIYLFIKYI